LFDTGDAAIPLGKERRHARCGPARPGRRHRRHLIFTVGLGIGDTDVFDRGGILSAIIGTVIVLVVVGFIARRRGAAGP
jgi:hypothetical protein